MEEKKHPFLKFLVIAIIIGAIIFVVVKCIDYKTQNNGDTPTNTQGQQHLTRRSARASDISISQSSEFSLSAIYKLTPNVDIEDLQVTIYFLDGSNNNVATKVKAIGNVIANTEYSFSFGMTDFNLSELMKMQRWRWEVTGGTVSYFA